MSVISAETQAMYWAKMVSFMCYRDQLHYELTHAFSDEELTSVTPTDVERYMKFRAYGVPEPGTDDRPKLLRGSSLMVIKKSISFFIPNRLPSWDPGRNCGNPTKSIAVNNVIKVVTRHECRSEGAQCKVKRALTKIEFVKALSLFEAKESFHHRHRIPTMMKYQYHLIARSDDIAHFKIEDLSGHKDQRFQFLALQVKVRWSKAVLDERQCPPQILLGSMDPEFCLLLALAVYLEYWMSFRNGMSCSLLWSEQLNATPATISRLKSSYLTNLHDIPFADAEFRAMSRSGEETDLGSHSLRKYAASWSKMQGCTMEDIETRGRWKRHSSRMVDRYISVDQPHTDAKVEAVLCVGGPMKYMLVDDGGITWAWIKEHVVPGIAQKFGPLNTIVEVLALPLLWACHDPVESRRVPLELGSRIRVAYGLIRILPPEVNPVKRVMLAVYQIQEQLCIDPLISEEVEAESTPALRATGSQGNNSQTTGLLIQLQQQRQQMETMQQTLATVISTTATNLQLHCNSMFAIVNRNISRVAVQPPRMATPLQRQQNLLIQEHDNNQLPAELSPLPRSLILLWQEWQTGIGGRKPAKDFTPSERGAVKFNFSRRKCVWDTIDRLIRSRPGYTAASAIRSIKLSYGENLSVTMVIDAIVRDKKKGGHPNLR
jgi:hypothetical protein